MLAPKHKGNTVQKSKGPPSSLIRPPFVPIWRCIPDDLDIADHNALAHADAMGSFHQHLDRHLILALFSWRGDGDAESPRAPGSHIVIAEQNRPNLRRLDWCAALIQKDHTETKSGRFGSARQSQVVPVGDVKGNMPK